MEAAGIERPEEYHGIKQQPFTGIPMNYSFDNPDAPNAKKNQYYEMFGNRAIWADGWKAVTLHGNRMPWEANVVIPFEDDVWELYHVAEDFSENNDLAKENPQKLEEMKQLLGFDSRVLSSLYEWYLPADKRFYKKNQD